QGQVQHEGRELPRTGVDILPAIPPVLSGAAGAGFPNVVVDSDGVRRRIDLLAEVDNAYFGQLIMAPMLDLLQNPAIVISDNRVVLQGAVLPGDEEPTDIEIPLASDGRMLINWPNTTFLESFRHQTFYRLVYHWETEADIVGNLRTMSEYGYLDFYQSDFFGSGSELLDLYDFAESLQADVAAGGDRSQIADWREYREMFFDEVGVLLNGETQQFLAEAYDAAILDPEISPELAQDYQAAKDLAIELFQATGDLYRPFIENRQVLQAEVPGSKIIIGWTGTSTTDIGVNPFEQEYVNVGTHAAVYNTIVQQDFLDDTPWWVPLAVSLVLSLLITVVTRGLKPAFSLVAGFGTLILIVVAGVALFITTGIYVNMVTPLVSVFLTFITLTFTKFLSINREKNFIRNAFNHYLSTDVISEIITDPEKLGLGGVKKNLTAIFTDVAGFSTISEALEPGQLVQLLNRYLSEMCDVVLDEKGTIDKFEGDAIIAFFGAPLDMTLVDSAVKGCRSAIRMKKLEERLNQEFLGEKLTPNPPLTRIGVNSGEMIVGNMGTKDRMDYTMMGHNVNLAARLEGVNKRYGTWILVSEQTYDKTDRAFSVRKLDRVRVVGISEPVRLYELIDLREDVDGDQNLIDKLRTFNAGLVAFEEKAWGEAGKNFKVVLDEYPEDGPAKYYLEWLEKFKKTPPPSDWDGVFNLTMK
ncbi:MAG: CHASE2 domain-containing protein, partial [Spirochaetaceae bacterium]|nr:CHASE2 domain-containing protein [Spirochaetaceae bacterium]